MGQNIVKIYFLLWILIIGCEKGSEDIPCVTKMPCDTFSCFIDDTNILVWEDIFSDSITTLVGQTITVKSKVYWHTDFGCYRDTVPENNPAGPVTLLFEKANDFIDNHSLHKQNRGNMFLISDQIEKYIDCEEKQEKYALNCNELSNNGIYYLIQGKIKYRDWLGVDEEVLANPNFIIQSNNVVYWSQTFEFVSEMICVFY